MPPWAHPNPNTKQHLDQLAILHSSRQRVPILYNGSSLPPLKLPLRMGGSEPPPFNTWFLGPIQAHNPNCILTGTAVCAQLTAECPYTWQWAPPSSPQSYPFPWGSGSHLIRGSLGPPKSSTQSASWSIQQFLQGTLVWQTDRPIYRPC